MRREKSNGKFAPWLFRFAAFDDGEQTHDLVSDGGDTSLSRDKENKTVFSGQITIGAGSNVFQTGWAELIKAAKKALPCWNVDTQVIWDRFLAFNRFRGKGVVEALVLLPLVLPRYGLRALRPARGSARRGARLRRSRSGGGSASGSSCSATFCG